MSWLELKIPPPVLALGWGALMWGISRAFPPIGVQGSVRIVLAALVAAVALLIAGAAWWGFRRARTTVDPTRPHAASNLVATGAYRFTRNPMYLGLLMLLAAWAVYLASVPALLMLPLLMGYLSRFQILPEERALASRFGEAYTAYQRRVRRWL